MKIHPLAFAALVALALSPAAPRALTAPAYAAEPAVQHALAPTGALRVGVYPHSLFSMVEGPTPQDAQGVGYDLGRQLAAALGVPFQPVVFPWNGPLLNAVAAGEVDIVFTNATPERAKQMDFSQPFMAVEKSFLVPANSALKTIADAVKPGLQIGVSGGPSMARELREIYPAITMLFVVPRMADELLTIGRIDAFASDNVLLYQLSDEIPGSRVLPGHWGVEHFSAAIPHGRRAGMPFLRDFIAKAKADGSVAKAIARANLRGAVAQDGKE